MDDISSGIISCLCDWSGLIRDIPTNFNIANFLKCPKCGTEDLIYASTDLEKKFMHRKSTYLANINTSVVYTDTKNSDVMLPKSKVSIFVTIGNHIYYFSTFPDLTELEDQFCSLDADHSKIEIAAERFIEKQQLKTIYKSKSTLEDCWGRVNFATTLAFYSDIADLLMKNIKKNSSFVFNAS